MCVYVEWNNTLYDDVCMTHCKPTSTSTHITPYLQDAVHLGLDHVHVSLSVLHLKTRVEMCDSIIAVGECGDSIIADRDLQQ